jgi:hypothetical protein
LWVYARLRPLPWDMPDLDAENEVIANPAMTSLLPVHH